MVVFTVDDLDAHCRAWQQDTAAAINLLSSRRRLQLILNVDDPVLPLLFRGTVSCFRDRTQLAGACSGGVVATPMLALTRGKS
jgi:hypothetical protein